ncbi:Os08g0546532 [Oryza sativa Japonica Group]|uniref:Os08g0546532 protein n=1 Tax=Oryza sativa subsp. japonica TaxID=39947 RepID=C7J6A7_ORYSJ|nr:Os08g0546532 [Oryza sativa Japonica Group]|eukprot:NP_001175683.1 Os08g0546532 [Oryza sativa Japonica Group]
MNTSEGEQQSIHVHVAKQQVRRIVLSLESKISTSTQA